MAKFDWTETFALHVPEIDGDHQTMLALMKAVQKAVNAGDPESARRYLRRVLEFTERHFRNEEAFLRGAGYGDVERHTQYHSALLERAQDLETACAQIHSPRERAYCHAQLLDFLADDVMRGDLSLKLFLEENGWTVPS